MRSCNPPRKPGKTAEVSIIRLRPRLCRDRSVSARGYAGQVFCPTSPDVFSHSGFPARRDRVELYGGEAVPARGTDEGRDSPANERRVVFGPVGPSFLTFSQNIPVFVSHFPDFGTIPPLIEGRRMSNLSADSHVPNTE